ncbi:MAG: cysteine desulfurase NifS [Clostridia bacterium]|nr:cysteine desulfurase NifS [Clostridia bacterium]
MENRYIYLDHAATTPVRKEVLDEMYPYFSEKFGNTLSVHKWGREARQAVEAAREQVASALSCDPGQVYFTAGATESDNWAIKGYAYANRNKGNHIITSQVEHHAVLHTCETLAKEGFEVTYLPVDEYGRIRIEELKAAITDKTILVTIMFANNEIGTIMPVKEIGAVCKEHNVPFHCDAVQAVGKVPIDVNELNISMLALSAHKFYGPKGVGAMYIKKGIRLNSLIEGGAHEKNKRAGTLNHVGIVGLGKAIELAIAEMDEEGARQTALRDALIKGMTERIPEVRLNGHPTERLCNNVNMSYRYVEGEALLLSLDMMGIGVSSGSACTSGSLDPSHVLLAIGLPHEIAHGSVRYTFGKMNTMEDVEYTIENMVKIVERLRAMSPLG